MCVDIDGISSLSVCMCMLVQGGSNGSVASGRSRSSDSLVIAWCDAPRHRRLSLARSVGRSVTVCLSVCSRLLCSIIAKFHYTGPTRALPDPTGPARTRTDPHGLCRRPARTQRSFAAKKSVRVRAGPVGSGRARVMEFSYYFAASMLLRRTFLLTSA